MQVTVPMASDGLANAKWLQSTGVSENVPFNEATAESLLAAIRKVGGDPSYNTKMKELSAMLRDQIDNPLDRAVWWIEHLIRHPKFSEHMRSKVHDLAWYQYLLLDVAAVLIAIGVAVTFVVYKVVALLLGLCCGSSGKKRKRD